MNIVSLCLITNLTTNTQLSISYLQQQNHLQKELIIDLTKRTFKNITLLRSQLRKILERLGEHASDTGTDTSEIKSQLEETKKTVSWLEEKSRHEWKKGCPQHGLTNGSLCYVLRREKLNYTSAATSCVNEGGFLARIPDLTIVDIVTKTFPGSPFFVDGYFNRTAEKWLTWDQEDADYLPWDINSPQTDGDCVYAFRGGYKSWQCHAAFYYLCEY